MRQIILLGLVLVLASCGGRSAPERGAVTRLATGPINSACLTSDRRARSRQLCGCIQAVANTTLSRSEQRTAARFYRDPQRAQDIRQSDRSSHEAFWQRYRAYADSAERICG